MDNYEFLLKYRFIGIVELMVGLLVFATIFTMGSCVIGGLYKYQQEENARKINEFYHKRFMTVI